VLVDGDLGGGEGELHPNLPSGSNVSGHPRAKFNHPGKQEKGLSI